MRFNALWTKRTALGWFWLALAMIWTATTAQAQLYIDVYPSQDNPDSQTLWIFSGSSTANRGSSIRSSQNYHARDSWKISGLYNVNTPTNRFFDISPLFSSTNNPIDIESIQVRENFGSNRTNAPTITIGIHKQTHRQDFYERQKCR